MPFLPQECWLAKHGSAVKPYLDAARAKADEWIDRDFDKWNAKLPEWKKEGSAAFERHRDGVKRQVIDRGDFLSFDVPDSTLTYAYDVNPQGEIVGHFRTAPAGSLVLSRQGWRIHGPRYSWLEQCTSTGHQRTRRYRGLLR